MTATTQRVAMFAEARQFANFLDPLRSQLRKCVNSCEMSLRKRACNHLPTAEQLMSEALQVSYDREMDVITIEGIRYSGELFRTFGMAPVGTWLRIMERENLVLTTYTPSKDLAIKFDSLLRAANGRES